MIRGRVNSTEEPENDDEVESVGLVLSSDDVDDEETKVASHRHGATVTPLGKQQDIGIGLTSNEKHVRPTSRHEFHQRFKVPHQSDPPHH